MSSVRVIGPPCGCVGNDRIVSSATRVTLTTTDDTHCGRASRRERIVSRETDTLSMNRQTALLDDIASLGRILTVWAHPDDESYLAGAVMAIARAQGQAVTCLTATRGDHAEREEARSQIGQARCDELAGALRTLGV